MYYLDFVRDISEVSLEKFPDDDNDIKRMAKRTNRALFYSYKDSSPLNPIEFSYKNIVSDAANIAYNNICALGTVQYLSKLDY